MKKTLIFLLLACLTLSAGCESQRGVLKTQHAAAIPADSAYRYLSEKNQDLAQSDWREARALLYPDYVVGHTVSSGDTSILSEFEHSAVRTERDYYSRAFKKESSSNRLHRLVAFAAIVLLGVGTAVGGFVYRRKQFSNRMREETLRNLALSLTRQVDELKNDQEVLQQRFAKGLQSRYQEMGELFKTVAGTNDENRSLKQGLLYDKVRKAMAAFQADENGKVLLEDQLNQSFDQLMAHFRIEFPGRSEEYYRFAAYMFAGFDKDAVMAFTGIRSRDAIYSRKKRLRQEVGHSNAPHKTQFMHFLSCVVVFIILNSCTNPTCTIDGFVSDNRIGEGVMAIAKSDGNKEQVAVPVVGQHFTLQLPRDVRVSWNIDFYQADGDRIGEDEMDLFLSVIPDTKRMKIDFDTKQTIGSPLTEELNRLINQTLHAFDWTLEMNVAQNAGDEFTLNKLMQGSQRRFTDLLFAAWREHPHDAVGLQAMKWIAPMMSGSELSSILEVADDFIRYHPDIAPLLSAPDASSGILTEFGRLLRQGKPVLTVFWAGWCPSSCREMEQVEKLALDYEEAELKIIGVNVADTKESLDQAILDRHFTGRQIFDPYGQITEHFGIDSIPCLLFFDKSGKVSQKSISLRQIHLSSPF